ncbi:MAG TPA: spermidine/putrescine ABC transporter substrate-binding protein [Jiangellales bacterium]|nr:spermidine/putrescine ABC transporter substrate-binding protein [Jiangellales bacterium]
MTRPTRPTDLSPAARALLQAGLSRRRFLRGTGLGGAALLGGGLLSACGADPGGTTEADSGEEVEDRSDEDLTLNFSNWQLYIDVDEEDPNLRPTLEQFTEETGVTVNYTEDINDNDSFYARISPQLRAGQDTGRDLMALTDWMAARLIRQEFVQEINEDNIPDVRANMLEALRTPSWDEERAFSVPWQSGFAGIAYNQALTGEIRTIEELLSREELRGRVTALLEWRDTVGLIMIGQGVDISSDFSDDEFMAGIDRLQKAVDAGQIRQFTGNEYSEGLASGDIAACFAWSGDVIQLQLDNPDLRFVIPDEGCTLWSDNLQIPVLAQHKKNAELLMNHYYDPAVAAELAAWVNFISPVEGAQEAMTEIDPELAENQLIFPTQDTLAQTYLFRGLTEEEEQSYTQAFNTVIGA